MFHSIGFEWPNDTKLLIEWHGGLEGDALAPPPLLAMCTAELKHDAFGQAGIPALCWRESEDALFEPIQLRENTEYLIDVNLPVPRQDAENAWKDDKSWPLATVSHAYESDPPRRWIEADGRLVVTGRLNFRSYVGSAELAIPGVAPIMVEVICAKFGYSDDFRQLLNAIAEEYAMLLMEIESPTFARFTLADASRPQVMTFLFLLRHAMDETRLPSAVESLLAAPRSTMHLYERIVPTGLQKNPPRGDFLHRLPEGMLSPDGPLGTLFRGYTPAVLPETVKTETTDTPENRYVKAFLENLRDAADDLHVLLSEHDKPVVARQVDAWSMRIAEWLEHPIWKDVRRMTHFPSNSQVLQKAAAYREVLWTDLRMQLGMSLPWSADNQTETEVRGDLRPVSQMYEYWCFFFLRTVLRMICGQEVRGTGNLIRETDDGLGVVLRRGTESRVHFRYENKDGGSAVIYLYYNRKFEKSNGNSWDGTYSAQLNPDFSILVECGGKRHWLHFDAKYRLDLTNWQAEINENADVLLEMESDYTNAEDVRVASTFKRNDLFKMHTYRDALLGSRGSYVLFPGSKSEGEIFIRFPGVEHSETGPHIPSVGAFQATPTQQADQSTRLGRFILQCIERLVAASDYQEETGIKTADNI